MASNEKRPLGRRDFVKLLAGAAVVAGGGGLIVRRFQQHDLTPHQKVAVRELALDKLGKLPKRKLGTRMGKMEVTPIVMSQDWHPTLIEPGLAAGINYIHKAGYWKNLPEALKKRDRESYYTDITVDSTPEHSDDEELAYNQVVTSLRENGLRYYDVYKAHYGWRNLDEFKKQRGTHRAFERLKKEGKVKYFGVSQHDFVKYPEIIAAEIDEGLIDHMQVFYSYGRSQTDLDIFEKAHKAGIGMMAMKIFAQGSGLMRGDSARQQALKAPGMPGRALIRHALTAPGSDGKPVFDCCVSALANFDMFEENIGAFAQKTALAEGFQVDSSHFV